VAVSVIVICVSCVLSSAGASRDSGTYTIMVASRTMLAVFCEVGEVDECQLLPVSELMLM
jgi:hypothetical protein